jgi:hypothetical protein
VSGRIRTNCQVVIVLVVAGLAFFAQAYSSVSSFSDDDRTHYLIARYSWTHPLLFLDLWGRPHTRCFLRHLLNLASAADVFNILVSLASCYVAFEIARTLGPGNAWLAAAFTALQPLFVLLSDGLTEPLFSLVLGASVLLYLREDFRAS